MLSLLYLLTYLLTVLIAVQMVMLEYVTSKALTRETCEIIKVWTLFNNFFRFFFIGLPLSLLCIALKLIFICSLMVAQ